MNQEKLVDTKALTVEEDEVRDSKLNRIYVLGNGGVTFLEVSSPVKLVLKKEENSLRYSHFYLTLIYCLLFNECVGLPWFFNPGSILLISFMTINVIYEIRLYKDNATEGLIGKFFLGKTTYFLNKPTWDVLYLQMFFPFVSLFLIVSCLDEFSMSYTGSFTLAYLLFVWNFKNRRGALYKHCVDSYNFLLRERSKKTEDKPVYDELGFDILSSSLAIDIVDCDFWAHKSFREFFIFEIFSALDYIAIKNLKYSLPENLQSLVNMVQENGSMKIDVKKIISYLNSGSASIEDVSAILNLAFQIRNASKHGKFQDFLTKHNPK